MDDFVDFDFLDDFFDLLLLLLLLVLLPNGARDGESDDGKLGSHVGAASASDDLLLLLELLLAEIGTLEGSATSSSREWRMPVRYESERHK